MYSLHHDSTSSVVILYRGNCHDGCVAAFTLWHELHNKAEYFPMCGKSDPPDVSGKIVYILDFSFPYDVINDMIKQARALLLIDHRKETQNDLVNIPDKHKIIDLNECTA